MKKSDSKSNTEVKTGIIFFDVILALLIIFSSFLLIKTPLGSAALAFGFAMLTITLILKIIQRW